MLNSFDYVIVKPELKTEKGQEKYEIAKGQHTEIKSIEKG